MLSEPLPSELLARLFNWQARKYLLWWTRLLATELDQVGHPLCRITQVILHDCPVVSARAHGRRPGHPCGHGRSN